MTETENLIRRKIERALVERHDQYPTPGAYLYRLFGTASHGHQWHDGQYLDGSESAGDPRSEPTLEAFAYALAAVENDRLLDTPALKAQRERLSTDIWDRRNDYKRLVREISRHTDPAGAEAYGCTQVGPYAENCGFNTIAETARPEWVRLARDFARALQRSVETLRDRAGRDAALEKWHAVLPDILDRLEARLQEHAAPQLEMSA